MIRISLIRVAYSSAKRMMSLLPCELGSLRLSCEGPSNGLSTGKLDYIV